MSLEQAIHARWTADAELSALVPAARLSTGAARGGPAIPYATLSRQGGGPAIRTNTGTVVEETRVRLSVWTSDLDQGQQIAREMAAAFDGAEFDLSAGRVLNMRRDKSGQEPHDDRLHDDGMWHIFHEYIVLTRN